MLDSISKLCYYIAIISFEEVLKMKHIIYTTESDDYIAGNKIPAIFLFFP